MSSTRARWKPRRTRTSAPAVEEGVEGASARRSQLGGLVVALEDIGHHRPEVEGGRSPRRGRVHVHGGVEAEQRAVDHVGEGVVHPLPRVGVGGGRPQDAGHVMGAGQALEQEVDQRVELAGRQGRGRQPGPEEGHGVRTGADRSAGDRLVALGRRLKGLVDGLIALVDLAVAGHPAAQRRPAVAVRTDRPEGFGRRVHLAGDLAREVPEHVLLAGEVLVEGHPGAPGDLGDAVDAAPVVADLAEDLEGGVEDPLLGALAASPDVGVVRERGAPLHRPGWALGGGLARGFGVGGHRRDAGGSVSPRLGPGP